MSDDQGDAEFEASLAGLGDGPQNGAGGAAAGGTDRALDEVRRTVEDLATRVGADVGEDLAQIRGALDRIEARLGTERGTLVEQQLDKGLRQLNEEIAREQLTEDDDPEGRLQTQLILQARLVEQRAHSLEVKANITTPMPRNPTKLSIPPRVPSSRPKMR